MRMQQASVTALHSNMPPTKRRTHKHTNSVNAIQINANSCSVISKRMFSIKPMTLRKASIHQNTEQTRQTIKSVFYLSPTKQQHSQYSEYNGDELTLSPSFRIYIFQYTYTSTYIRTTYINTCTHAHNDTQINPKYHDVKNHSMVAY